jgi:rubrerythrin
MSGSAPVGHLADGTPYYAPLGQLPYDPDEDRVQCHLCGEWFCQVGGSHLLRKHGWTMGEYRRAFGLPKRISVCSVGVSDRRRQKILPRIAEGGDFAATPGRFRRDRQSAKTGGANAAKTRIGGGVRQPASELPKLVGEWHQQRNRGLSLDALGVSSPQRAWWQCAGCGHEWEASVRSRTNGSGCPRCRHENDLRILREASQRNSARARRERSLAIVRPDLIPEWHRARNGELDPTAIAAWWRCPQCGHEWQARIDNRARGSGCPACAGRHTPAAR